MTSRNEQEKFNLQRRQTLALEAIARSLSQMLLISPQESAEYGPVLIGTGEVLAEQATATIEDRARALLCPELATALSQRAEYGVQKYGQRLDDNDQPARAWIIHLAQELLDALQYALKAGEDALVGTGRDSERPASQPRPDDC